MNSQLVAKGRHPSLLLPSFPMDLTILSPSIVAKDIGYLSFDFITFPWRGESRLLSGWIGGGGGGIAGFNSLLDDMCSAQVPVGKGAHILVIAP